MRFINNFIIKQEDKAQRCDNNFYTHTHIYIVTADKHYRKIATWDLTAFENGTGLGEKYPNIKPGITDSV